MVPITSSFVVLLLIGRRNRLVRLVSEGSSTTTARVMLLDRRPEFHVLKGVRVDGRRLGARWRMDLALGQHFFSWSAAAAGRRVGFLFGHQFVDVGRHLAAPHLHRLPWRHPEFTRVLEEFLERAIAETGEWNVAAFGFRIVAYQIGKGGFFARVGERAENEDGRLSVGRRRCSGHRVERVRVTFAGEDRAAANNKIDTIFIRIFGKILKCKKLF